MSLLIELIVEKEDHVVLIFVGQLHLSIFFHKFLKRFIFNGGLLFRIHINQIQLIFIHNQNVSHKI